MLLCMEGSRAIWKPAVSPFIEFITSASCTLSLGHHCGIPVLTKELPRPGLYSISKSLAVGNVLGYLTVVLHL